MMHPLYQQLELSARRQQCNRLQESEQAWLAQQSARQQSGSAGLLNLIQGLKTLVVKEKVDKNCCCHAT